MNRRLIATLTVLAFSACLTGCVGRTRFPAYYTLHVPPAIDAPSTSARGPSLAVREFRSPAYLRQGAVVYRTSPEQIGFYQYHRWAIDPRELVTSTIIDRLRATGRFTEVRAYDGRSDIDYVLSGHLEKLEEVDYATGVRVEVALSAEITDPRAGKVVWYNSASESAQVEKRNVPGIVAGLSRATDRTIQKLLASITVPTTSSLNSSLQK